jgi:hypothetical protein
MTVESNRELVEKLIAQFRERVPAEPLSWIDEYIEHNGCGLAFVCLCESLVTLHAQLDVLEYEAFARAGRGMKLTPQYWQPLRPH